jgi:hypothetical protein
VAYVMVACNQWRFLLCSNIPDPCAARFNSYEGGGVAGRQGLHVGVLYCKGIHDFRIDRKCVSERPLMLSITSIEKSDSVIPNKGIYLVQIFKRELSREQCN